MNVIKFKKRASTFNLVALFITSSYLLSCSNQHELKPIESEMIVGIDPDFVPEPDPVDNARTSAGETVILNKVRLWLGGGENPEGTFKIKIVRVSDSHVMVTSEKIKGSDLKYIIDQNRLLDPEKVIFNLSSVTLKLKAGTKYRIEIECSTVADTFDEGIIWADYFDFQNINGRYAPGTETTRLIFDDGSEEMRTPDTHADFMFETEIRRSNGTTYTDQSQKKSNSFKSVNAILFGEGETKEVFGQEFVPSVR